MERKSHNIIEKLVLEIQKMNPKQKLKQKPITNIRIVES
jgi:hypothetical protein